MQISSGAARAYEFEQFIQELLEQSPGIDLTNAPGPYGTDYGFDFAVIRNNQPLLIEVKLATPQTSYRLEQMNTRLKVAAGRYKELHPGPEPELVLAFPGVLSESKMSVAARSGLEIWDGPSLRARAQQLGIHVPPYIAAEITEDAGWQDGDYKYTHALRVIQKTLKNSRLITAVMTSGNALMGPR